MDTSRTDSHRYLQHLRTVISQSQNTNGLISVPNILIPSAWLPNRVVKDTKPDVEDIVLNWFRSLGLRGDRTNRSVYYSGYPGLFRELVEPPPWIEISMDDMEENISPKRAREIEPLYVQVAQGNNLEDEYQLYAKRSGRQLTEGILPRLSTQEQIKLPDIVELHYQMSLEYFRELLLLSHMLGSELVADLASAVLDEEILLPATGAPDLFLWSRDSVQPFWLFAEVKGPQDYLRPSQYEWIVSNWMSIQGHIIIVSVV